VNFGESSRVKNFRFAMDFPIDAAAGQGKDAAVVAVVWFVRGVPTLKRPSFQTLFRHPEPVGGSAM
jgi:hypothetical protein